MDQTCVPLEPAFGPSASMVVKSKQAAYAVGVWVALGVTSAWAVPPPPSPPTVIVPNPRSLSRGSELEGVKLQEIMALARSGDASAAFRLSHHYEAVEDMAKGRYWTTVAAARGHRVAQYNLGFSKAKADDCLTLAEAKGWLEEFSRLDGYRDPGVAPALEAKYTQLCETRRD